MAADFVVRVGTPPVLGDAAAASAILSKRGEIVGMPWLVKLGLEGRLFVANRGTETTPIASGHTVIDQDQPELVVRVPSGTLIIPLYLETNVEISGGTVTELLAATYNIDIGNGTSTAVTPVNMNTGSGRNTNCLVRREYTANSTAPTGIAEFYRETIGLDLDANAIRGHFHWALSENSVVPILQGPASLAMYQATATSSSSFCTVVWAEFLTSELV